MNGDGQWIDAPPIPGAFIINIGDMIETMSNGDFIATSDFDSPQKRSRMTRAPGNSAPNWPKLSRRTSLR